MFRKAVLPLIVLLSVATALLLAQAPLPPPVIYTQRIAIVGYRYVAPKDAATYPGNYPLTYVDIGPCSAFAGWCGALDTKTGLPIGPTPTSFAYFGLIDVAGTGFPPGIVPLGPPYATLPAGTTGLANALAAQTTTYNANLARTGGANGGVLVGYMMNKP